MIHVTRQPPLMLNCHILYVVASLQYCTAMGKRATEIPISLHVNETSFGFIVLWDRIKFIEVIIVWQNYA